MSEGPGSDTEMFYSPTSEPEIRSEASTATKPTYRTEMVKISDHPLGRYSVNYIFKVLTQIPRAIVYNHPDYVKFNVYRMLWWESTLQGKFLDRFFPNCLTFEDWMSLDTGQILKRGTKGAFFTKSRSSQANHWHPADKACARTLESGEPVYRCEECGFDETCVLCYNCFNKDDHIGHNVTMYTTRGIGGICDCGDPEAFKNLNCKCTRTVENGEVPEELEFNTRDTLEAALDYIINVLHYTINTLPVLMHHMDDPGSSLTSEKLSDISSFPGVLDEHVILDRMNDHERWYLVVWNDENHNRDEAYNALKKALGREVSFMDNMVTEIDQKGKCVLHRAPNPDILQYRHKIILESGLSSSIISSRDYNRLNVIESIFGWIKEILNFQSQRPFRDMSVSVLSEVLLGEAQVFEELPIQKWADGLSDDLKPEFQKVLNGMFTTNIYNRSESGISSGIRPTDLATDFKSIQGEVKTSPLKLSRIQMLMSYEMRLHKSVRKMLPNILIPPLVSDVKSKAMFARQILQVYPVLLQNIANSDREDHLNILLEVNSQIFTCPKCVDQMLAENGYEIVISALISVIEESSSKLNKETGYPVVVDISKEQPIAYKRIKTALIRGIRDITCLSSRASNGNIFDDPKNFALSILLLRSFQEFWPMKKKYGDHVEREIFDFVVHLEFSLPILNIAKSIGTSEFDIESSRRKVGFLLDFLQMRILKSKPDGMIDFKIDEQLVSLINPLNALLSYLIQTNGISKFQDIFLNMTKPFLNISDISLRSIVLGNQIKTGFWIRNGVSTSRQGSLYFESIMNDMTFFRDFHVNQISCVFDDPKNVLNNFLSRWNLLSWYMNEVNYDKTDYEDRFFSISEKFIVFMYNLLVEREGFLSLSAGERHDLTVKKTISYSLCSEPKSYSSIKNSVSTELQELSNFDEILYEVADYQPPSSLTDSGMFRLKPQIYRSLDPLSLYFDSSDFQDISDSLVKQISAETRQNENDVILTPKLTQDQSIPAFVGRSIGNFTKTKDFAKLIYKYLQVAIDTSDETYLPHLLHLIHAILVDDELQHGKNYLNDIFVDIPISDLLLTIVESKMSPRVVHKSDFLVEQFIEKDQRIVSNLVDCFGENFFNEYKQKKAGLFESDAEKQKKKNKERQLKVMKKFEKQRKKFLSMNKDYGAEDLEVQRSHSVNQDRTCVLCGEAETLQESIGLLASKTKTSCLWNLPRNRPAYVAHAFRPFDEQKMPVQNNEVYGLGYPYKSEETYFNYGSGETSVVSTCGHYIHHKCFKGALGFNKHYPCPLCRNLHNMYIPSFRDPKSVDEKSVVDLKLDYIPQLKKYNQIFNSSGTMKATMLKESLVDKGYDQRDFKPFHRIITTEVLDSLEDFVISNRNNCNSKYFASVLKLSTIIADTIKMNEISTRIDGAKSCANFLNQIPGSVKTLLRSLIQSRAILYADRESPILLGNDYDFAREISGLWDSVSLHVNGVFNEIVVLFFQTDESLQTLTRLGMTKMIIISLYSLLKREETINNLDTHGKPSTIPEPVFSSFRSVFNTVMSQLQIDIMAEDDITTYYYAVERLLLPFLRQMVIFKDVLTCESSGENSFRSIDSLEALEAHIGDQLYPDSTEALTDALSIPSYNKTIIGLADAEDEFLFESSIFDIVLNAKIPKYMESGILTLPYPGIVQLICLPEDFNECLMDGAGYSIKGKYERVICLHCSSKVKASKHSVHMLSCSRGIGIFFIPSKNVLRVCIHIGNSPPISIDVPAPYLTKHGESKKPRTPGEASLNHFRYEMLNKMWLNQGLFAFVTRSIFGARQNNDTVNFNFGEDFDDDEGDDDDDDEDDGDDDDQHDHHSNDDDDDDDDNDDDDDDDDDDSDADSFRGRRPVRVVGNVEYMYDSDDLEAFENEQDEFNPHQVIDISDLDGFGGFFP